MTGERKFQSWTTLRRFENYEIICPRTGYPLDAPQKLLREQENVIHGFDQVFAPLLPLLRFAGTTERRFKRSSAFSVVVRVIGSEYRCLGTGCSRPQKFK
jgi:hypothetical protein